MDDDKSVREAAMECLKQIKPTVRQAKIPAKIETHHKEQVKGHLTKQKTSPNK